MEGVFGGKRRGTSIILSIIKVLKKRSPDTIHKKVLTEVSRVVGK